MILAGSHLWKVHYSLLLWKCVRSEEVGCKKFEDLLQVHLWMKFGLLLMVFKSVLCLFFDGLLPANHNNDIQSLLFTTVGWHTLAKMHLHTDSMLAWLDESTKAFGKQIRHFQTILVAFSTHRNCLKKRLHAVNAKKKKKVSTNLMNPSPRAPVTSTATPAGTRKKNFNLILIKLHALGDYVKTIKTFGMIDSYSTHPVWMLLLYLLLVLI